MPTARLVKIDAWSYSRYTTYSQCPFKAKCTIIDRLREPEHPASANGTRVHEIADVVVSGELPKPDRDNAHLMEELAKVLKSKRLPEELECFRKEFAMLQKSKAIVRQMWGFDREWEPCRWDDWGRCWLRMKVDVHYLETLKKNGGLAVHIVDHKTGKVYEDHKLQRSLYALGAFLNYPDAKYVTAAHWYLDKGREEKESWNAEQLPALKKLWAAKTEAMLNDTTFAPRPGEYCRYCHFRKDNGGPCKF